MGDYPAVHGIADEAVVLGRHRRYGRGGRAGNTTWRRTGGYSNLETKTPYAASDFVRIASITKSFAATAAPQLVDSGQLTLDDPVERLVPGLPNGTTITLENLLVMTSGLFDVTADDGFTATFDQNPVMPWSFNDTLAIVKAHPPTFAPGAQMQYCDTNYAVLGEILAKVAGQPAGTVITRQVVEGLGLRSTSYPRQALARTRTPPRTSRASRTPRRPSTTPRAHRRSSTR